ncbi:MAG TPA: ferredoxin [Rubrobacteraceae bacterium]|nr:ferredoxin [Rubrobacteraceae bacterium]
MAEPRVEVDQEMCIGSGNCVEVAKGAFKLNDEDKAEVEDPTAVSIEDLRKAQEQCPVAAILVEEPEEPDE